MTYAMQKAHLCWSSKDRLSAPTDYDAFTAGWKAAKKDTRGRMTDKDKALQLRNKNKIKLGDVVGGMKLIDVGGGFRWVKCEKLE